ncbi:MAG: hypothetical protein D6785_13385 [Planctomycetota bacterium]|nr:MAG: hypothetical protein D6785_13385 [Planctomycetota bacterium]
MKREYFFYLSILIGPVFILITALAPVLVPKLRSRRGPCCGGKYTSYPTLPSTDSELQDQNKNGIPDDYEMGLAKKFNPSMAFYGKNIWPVDHRYLWAKGGSLKRRVYLKKGNYWIFQRVETLLSASKLESQPWNHYPDKEKKNGNLYQYKYYIDGPGENLGSLKKEMTWEREFIRLQGGVLENPTKCRFPPAQYAHFFWQDKQHLLIQYWFYYPYNKFINNHEGDWEHVNIVLKIEREKEDCFNPQKPYQKPVEFQYFFHQHYLKLKNPILIGDKKGGVHPLVFVGGQGSLWIPKIRIGNGYWSFSPIVWEKWEGEYSGASYPFPGRIDGSGGKGRFRKDERIPRISRWIHANDFQIILLPEPENLDYKKHPELSWLQLDFYSGNWTSPPNHFILSIAASNIAPLQPARKTTWNNRIPKALWNRYKKSDFQKPSLPKGWKVLSWGIFKN